MKSLVRKLKNVTSNLYTEFTSKIFMVLIAVFIGILIQSILVFFTQKKITKTIKFELYTDRYQNNHFTGQITVSFLNKSRQNSNGIIFFENCPTNIELSFPSTLLLKNQDTKLISPKDSLVFMSKKRTLFKKSIYPFPYNTQKDTITISFFLDADDLKAIKESK